MVNVDLGCAKWRDNSFFFAESEILCRILLKMRDNNLEVKMAAKKKKGDNRLEIGGNVNMSGGDFVNGNKSVRVDKGGVYAGGDIQGSTVVTGDHNQIGNTDTAQDELFRDLLKMIEQRPDTPPEDKDDLSASVEEIKAEADKGEKADETFLSRRLRNIERIAPDIADVVMATLANPAAGFAMVVRKVAERARKPSSA